MHAVLMGAGWVINLAVAEVVIRRRAARVRVARRGPPPGPVRRVRPYHEGHDEPPPLALGRTGRRAAATPARLARLGGIVTVLPLVALFEAAVRPDDVPWR